MAGGVARMCERIRATQRPCLAFKLLAAGRSCWNKDEVRENAGYARKHGQV